MDSSGIQNWRELANSIHNELTGKNSMFDLKEVCSWIGVTQQGNLGVVSARLTEFLLTGDIPKGRQNLDFVERRLTIDSEVWRNVTSFRHNHPRFRTDTNFITLLAPHKIFDDDKEEEEIVVPIQKKKKKRRRRGTGRKAIEIKYIEDTGRRNRIFSKRKMGIFKKFVELGILCGANYMVCVESPSGRSSMKCSQSFQAIGEGVLRRMKEARKQEKEGKLEGKKKKKKKKSVHQELRSSPASSSSGRPTPAPVMHDDMMMLRRRKKKNPPSPMDLEEEEE